MSTRGFVGFKVNNKKNRDGNIFGAYNQYDSYYSSLGLKMLSIYQKYTKEDFKKVFEGVEWLDREQVLANRYSILCEEFTEGEYVFEKFDKKVVNYYEFLHNGVYCEYAYVYNMERDTLEVYRGGYGAPQSEGLSNSSHLLRDDRVEYTHMVLEITRDMDWMDLVDMFKNIRVKDFCEEKNLYAETQYLNK